MPLRSKREKEEEREERKREKRERDRKEKDRGKEKTPMADPGYHSLPPTRLNGML